MRRPAILVTALFGVILGGFAIWCAALLSTVSDVRVQVEQHVRWLGDLQNIQALLGDPGRATTAAAQHELFSLDADVLAHRPADDPLVVEIAVAVVELRGQIDGSDHDAAAAAVNRAASTLRAQNAALSSQLGGHWSSLRLIAWGVIALAAGMLGALGYMSFVVASRIDNSSRRLSALSRRLEERAVAGRGVGHELGGPLTSAVTNMHLLRDRMRAGSDTREDEMKLLEDAISALARAKGTLQDLRASSDSNEDPTADVHDALDEALAATRVRHGGRLHVTLDSQRVEPAALPRVVARRLLTQVLDGAMDASPPDAAVLIRTRQEKASISIEFRIAGAAERGEMLERSDALNTASRTLQTVGGALTRRQEGNSSIVQIVLPRRTESSLRPTAPEVPGVPRLRILLIDDDDFVLSSVSRVLVRHEVVPESDPEQAVTRATTGNFDLILCDVMMPRKTGMEVFSEVTAVRPDLAARFVFMSGGSVEPEIAAFLEQAPARIDKPFGADELRRLVASYAQRVDPGERR